jgi:hypothetical protein
MTQSSVIRPDEGGRAPVSGGSDEEERGDELSFFVRKALPAGLTRLSPPLSHSRLVGNLEFDDAACQPAACPLPGFANPTCPIFSSVVLLTLLWHNGGLHNTLALGFLTVVSDAIAFSKPCRKGDGKQVICIYQECTRGFFLLIPKAWKHKSNEEKGTL